MMCSMQMVTVGSLKSKSCFWWSRLKKKEPSLPTCVPTVGGGGAGRSMFCFHLWSLGFKHSSPLRLTATMYIRAMLVGTPTATALMVAVSISQPAICS